MVSLSGLNTFSGQTQVSGPAALLLANAGALQNSTYAGGAANGLAFLPGIGSFTLGGLSGSDNLTLSDTGGAAVTLQVGNNGASTTYSGGLSGPGGLAKIGSGVLSLAGPNTYHGVTSVSQGTLALGPGGSLLNTSVTVGNGTSGNGVLQINGNYAIGSGNLAVSGGGGTTGQGVVNFNPAESSTSTLSIGGAMSVGGSSGSPGLLNFNVGNNSVDTIAAGSLAVNAGGAIIGLNQLPGLPIVTGTYNLITFGSGSGLSGLTFAGGATIINQYGDTFKLVSTATAEQLSVLAPPVAAYWTGAQGTSWSTLAGGSSTNWGNAGGTDINQLPGGSSNVVFTASGASNYAATTLDGNFAVSSLTFNNSGVVGIAAGTPATSTLTLTGTGGTSGITMNPGAGPVTISASLALGDAADLDEQFVQFLGHFGQRRQRRQYAHAGRLGRHDVFGNHRRRRWNRRRRQRPGGVDCPQCVYGPDHGQRRHAQPGRQRHDSRQHVGCRKRRRPAPFEQLDNAREQPRRRFGRRNAERRHLLDSGQQLQSRRRDRGRLDPWPGPLHANGLAWHLIGQKCRPYFRQQQRGAVQQPLLDSQRRQHAEHYRHDSRARRPRRELYRRRDHHGARRLRLLRRAQNAGAPSVNDPAAWIVVNGHSFAAL